MIVELSVVEQRYRAVLAVIAEGESVVEVASRVGVSRQTLHEWLSRYEAGGLAGLANRSHRPLSSPAQMPAVVEARVLEWRRQHPGWGPRRLRHELQRDGVEPLPSLSGIYRALKRAAMVEPGSRRHRAEKFRRWERGSPMELWQMDVVGGIVLADGTELKALTGIDDCAGSGHRNGMSQDIGNAGSPACGHVQTPARHHRRHLRRPHPGRGSSHLRCLAELGQQARRPL